MDRVVVVGASLAGVRAAGALRKHGYRGELIVLGDEPHAPYDRPPLSKEILSGAFTREKIALLKSEADWTLRLGERAEGLDLARRAIKLAREWLPFDGLVIATGVRARRLSNVDGFVLRTVDDALALQSALRAARTLAIVGAGFVGAEVASSVRRDGLKVTLIEQATLPLERQLGAQMAGVLARLHGEHGVELRTGVSVVERGDALLLSDGSRVEADAVLIAVGAQPNVEWLAGSGVALHDGVRCDAVCRVLRDTGEAIPGIVAAGDVAHYQSALFEEAFRVEHWTHAAEQADRAARTLLGDDTPWLNAPLFWSDQYGLRIQFAGRKGERIHVCEGTLEDRRFVALYGQGERLTGALALRRPAQLMRYRKLIEQRASFDEAVAATSP
jgi:NADPH-dependent 2,4-dienoyl-CoA reductase/sulfur reductase-like enzyme